MQTLEPDIRNLRAFLAVAEELSFTRAARRLHLSQQGLTDRIRRLETQLGAPLFVRTTRRVELSAVGAELLPDARLLVEQVDTIWARLETQTAHAPAHLRVGVSPSLVFGVLPRLLEIVAERAPEMELIAREIPMDELVQGVTDGDLDAGVALAPPPTPNLSSDVVDVSSADLMVAESHPLAERASVSLREISGTPVLLSPREISPGMHDAVMSACRAAGFEPEVLLLPRERGYLPRALFDGRAFAFWSTLSPHEYVRKGLVTVPLQEPRPRLELRLVSRRGTGGPGIRLLREALDQIAQELATASRPPR